MAEQNIVEVKEVHGIDQVNQWLGKGWLLLATGAGTQNDDGFASPYFRYAIGRPDGVYSK